MKIIQINATCDSGSTGKICIAISELLIKQGIENYIFYNIGDSEYPLGIKCSDKKYIKLQALKSRILGNYGFNSDKLTKRMIDFLDKIKPNIVLLHNIHGHDCNLDYLFSYFKAKNIKLVWTFHDCWAFTGYCPHFTMAKCDKWINGCSNCIQRKEYSWFIDRSNWLYRKKKELFSGLNLTIVVPSQWLANIVSKSFLNMYPIKIINNGIDLNIFKPTKGNFREKNNIAKEKYIILGVAFEWSIRKGIDVFIDLAMQLDSQKYQIVLVGTDDVIDNQLPKNIISLHRTQNQKELAEIYTSADVFVNPSREENFPSVNIEALACGTPVITFKTGGSPEIVDKNCGIVIDENLITMKETIIQVCKNKQYSKEACINRAKNYDKEKQYIRYIDLFREVTNE